MKMYPNSTIPRVRRTQSTTLRPISMRACPRWFVLCRCTGGPPNGEPADPRCRRQQPFATVLLPWQRTQTAEKWFGKPRSVMSLRSCAAPFGSVSPSDEQGDPLTARIWPSSPSQLSRPRSLLAAILAPTSEAAPLPSEPYDDGRNAVKEKTRFGVAAEGRGVHPAACPVGMGHGHRQGASADRGAVAARRLP